MIRFLLRFLGLWLLAGGFVALVLDGTRSIASSRVLFTPLGDALAAMSATGLGRALDAELPAGGWESLAMPLMQAPLAVVLLAIGLVLIVLGRKRA